MTTKEEHYNSMMLAVQRYAPNADMDLIERAYRYADGKHKDQLRKSGEPYIIHPLAVAEIVAEIGLDTDAIAAALLHDVSKGTPDHALAGAGLMSQLGYPVLAPLIAQHHDIEDPARVDEALVVYMADKLCRGDRRVSVSGRFRASFDKCRDAEALAAHDRRYKAALTAAHTINDICGKEVIPI